MPVTVATNFSATGDADVVADPKRGATWSISAPTQLSIPVSSKFTNMIEWLDMNYQEECAKVFAGKTLPPAEADYVGFRTWLDGDGGTLSRKPLAKRFRPEVDVHITDLSVTYDEANTYGIRVHDPEAHPDEKAAPRAALLFFHGGGWVHGEAKHDSDVCDFLASELRAVVFNVDYRLCPEYPFPLNHNDCYHSIGWVIEHAEQNNVDISRIGVCGISAGANLAAGAVLRDSVEHQSSRVRHLNLVVPVVCDTRRLPYPLNEKFGDLTEEMRSKVMMFMQIWVCYTGSPEPSTSPYISPLLADIPDSHPATHITVAGLDPIRDEGIAYARHLRSHGIDAQLDIVPGAPHGITMAPASVVAKQFFRDQVRVLNSALNSSW